MGDCGRARPISGRHFQDINIISKAMLPYRNFLFITLHMMLCVWIVPSALAGPEIAIQKILKSLDDSDLSQAEVTAQELVKSYPSFDLGQILLGDILMLHKSALPLLSKESDNSNQDRILNDLRAEARVRFAALAFTPPAGAVPNVWVNVASSHKRILIADTERSRLWVYRNQNGVPKLEANYYMSQGRAGDNKKREGDLKTPIGVYHITGHLSKLPPFYGVGALPINYPNEWDRKNKRTGSNIWLHGTPAEQYSRPPLASEGCLVLSNEDMNILISKAQKKTSTSNMDLVIITDNLSFISSDDARKTHASFEQAFTRSHGQAQAYVARYQPGRVKKPKIKGNIRNLTLVRYPDNGPMYLAQFDRIEQGKTIFHQEYWGLKNGEWRVQFEK